jgi:hypothetical protein
MLTSRPVGPRLEEDIELEVPNARRRLALLKVSPNGKYRLDKQSRLGGRSPHSFAPALAAAQLQ